MYLEKVTYNAPKMQKDGVHLLVLGVIHGNETCGSEGIARVIHEIDNKTIHLEKGHVTFIPVCNPGAYQKNERYVDVNLNRILKMHDQPKFYEEHIANELVPLIGAHDFILDLHSNHTKCDPFVFLDYPDDVSRKFCESLGVESVFTGWPDLFTDDEDYTTLACAHRAGKVSVTVECGEHHDPHSIDVAYQCIVNALIHLGMISKSNEETQQLPPRSNFVKMYRSFIKEKEGNLIKNWQHMDHVSEGDILAVYDDGQDEVSPINGYILLPNIGSKIGDEWFYLGTQES